MMREEERNGGGLDGCGSGKVVGRFGQEGEDGGGEGWLDEGEGMGWIGWSVFGF